MCGVLFAVADRLAAQSNDIAFAGDPLTDLTYVGEVALAGISDGEEIDPHGCEECGIDIVVQEYTNCNGHPVYQWYVSNPNPTNACAAVEAQISWTVQNGGRVVDLGFSQLAPDGFFEPGASITFTINGEVTALGGGTTCTFSQEFDPTVVRQGVYVSQPNSGQCNTSAAAYSKYLADFTAAADAYPVYLSANLNVDVPLVTSANWLVGSGLTVRVLEEQSFALTAGTMSTGECSTLWQGIIGEDDASVSLSGNATVSDAAVAVYAPSGQDVDIDIESATLARNFIGVRAESNASVLTMDQSTITSPFHKLPFECPAGTDPGQFCGRGYAGIVLEQVTGTQFLTSPNTLTQLSNGYLFTDSRAIVERHAFIDILEPCFEESGGYAFRAISNPTMGIGYARATGNTFSNCDVGVQAVDYSGNARHIVDSNTLNSVWVGIDLVLNEAVVDNNSTDVVSNAISALRLGSIASRQSAVPVGIASTTGDLEPARFSVVYNTIDVDYGDVDKGSVGIWSIHTGSSTRVFSPTINANVLTLSGANRQTGILLQGEWEARVGSNHLSVVGNGDFDRGIQLIDTKLSDICNNSVTMAGQLGTGIEVINSQENAISYNTLTDGQYGASWAVNCLPQGINRNFLEGSYQVGLYHFGPANMANTDDQYGKLNVFEPGLTEVTTVAQTALGGERYVVATPLQNSPPDDYLTVTTVIGQRACNTRVGDSEPAARSGSGSSARTPQYRVSYERTRRATAESVLSGTAGRNYAYTLGLHEELLRWPADADPRFGSFLATQATAPAGILADANVQLGSLGLSSTERAALDLAHDSEDPTAALPVLVAASAQRNSVMLTARQQLDRAYPGPGGAVLDARLAELTDKRPDAATLRAWRTEAERCLDDAGPAVYAYRRAYAAATGVLVEGTCAPPSSRPTGPSLGGARGEKSAPTLAPSAARTHVVVFGLDPELEPGSTLTVTDALGRPVRSVPAAASEQVTINIADLAPGLYRVSGGALPAPLTFTRL